MRAIGLFVGRLLRVEPGEGPVVALLWASSLCHGLALVCTDLAANTLFIAELGADLLPHAFLTLAAITPVASVIYARVRERARLPTLVSGTAMGLALGLSLFFVLLWSTQRAPAAIFLLQPWYRLQWLLSEFAFWSTANRVLTLRQSKRLFGLVGSGEILALIIGYPTAGLLVPFLGLVPLLCVAVILLLVYAALLRACAGWDLDTRERTNPRPAPRARTSAPGRERGHGHLGAIAALIGAGSLTFFIIAIAFYNGTSARFPDEADLARFLGFFWGSTSVGILLFRSLGYARVMERWGLDTCLLVTPLCALGFAVAAGFTGAVGGDVALFFWLLGTGRWILEVLYVTLAKLGVVVLYQPLASGQRLAAQTLMASRIEPLAVAASGGVLVLLQAIPGFAAPHMLVVASIAALVWLWRARAAIASYARALDRVLDRGSDRADPDHDTWVVTDGVTEARVVAALDRAFASGRSADVLLALELLEETGHPTVEWRAHELLGHPDPDVRCAALSCLVRQPERAAVSAATIRDLLDRDDAPRVRAWALRALVATATDRQELVRHALESDPLLVREAALLELARTPPLMRAGCDLVAHMHALARSHLDAERALVASVIGQLEHPEDRISCADIIHHLLADSAPLVVRAALVAAGHMGESAPWPDIIQCFSEPRFAAAARAGARRGGQASIAAMTRYFLDPSAPVPALVSMARVLGQIGGPDAWPLLHHRIADPDEVLRTHVARALTSCGYRAPVDQISALDARVHTDIDELVELLGAIRDLVAWPACAPPGPGSSSTSARGAPILLTALEDQRKRARTRIVHTLSWRHDAGPRRALCGNLEHPDEQRRGYALERLQLGLPAQLARAVVPALDIGPAAEILERMDKRVPPRPVPVHLQHILSCTSKPRPSLWVRVWALRAIGEERIAELEKAVAAAVADSHPLVRETASWAMVQLARPAAAPHPDEFPTSEDKTMFTTVEIVLLLHGTPLFADVPSNVLGRVARFMRPVTIPAGERFIEQGERGERLYLVLRGEVDAHEDGSFLARRGPGSMFGEMDITSDRPCTSSCTAVADVLALELGRDDFELLLEETPELARSIIRTLAKRLDDSGRDTMARQRSTRRNAELNWRT